jgi:hypothetical protein
VRAASPLLLEVRFSFDAADSTRKAVHNRSNEVGSSRKVYVIESTRGDLHLHAISTHISEFDFFSC